MGPPFEPKIGDLVIIKGSGVARILRLEVTGRWGRLWEPDGDSRRGRAYVQTWYPVEGTRLVPFTDIVFRCSDPATMPPGRPMGPVDRRGDRRAARRKLTNPQK
jgi:hypothetical protein